MKFFKYHGTGNDFIVIEAIYGRPEWLDADAVKLLCDRHFGIGADGVLLIESGSMAKFFMRVFNADGSEAEMCGNGIRCVAKHVYERMGERENLIPIETLAGVKKCRIELGPDGSVTAVAVSLGAPVLDRLHIPISGTGEVVDLAVSALGRQFRGTAVGMGNPHFVVFEGLDMEEAARYGPMISTSPMFPNQTNVEFVQTVGPSHFRVLVWERGCGLTLACGTGAGATAVAAVLTGRCRSGDPLIIELPGGKLKITVSRGLDDVVLEGPAVRVFEGELDKNFSDLLTL